MSASVDVLQSRSRQEVNKLQCHNQQAETPSEDDRGLIVSAITDVAKGFVDTVSNFINMIWPKNETKEPAKPNPVCDDVTIDVHGMVVYDQPVEGFVEVAFADLIEPAPRRQQLAPIDVAIQAIRPAASSPMPIPETPKDLYPTKERPERKERNFV